RLSRVRSIEYTSIGLDPAPGITRIADLTALPDSDSSFDAIVCIHVLEHIEDDSAAMAEMWRVLAPGGVAVINVPLALDQDTYEDPSVVDPNERRRLFGEPDHVRVYGRDLRTRLEAVGFEVELFRADQLEPATVVFNGLTLDEHVFHCVKAAGS
ncbi:MAG: methyltransferase domain-containing protein, partial [Acidimicrobiia bacterium]|nr:methyltransferase domain-containing protein [Acidimicrobiia bacterium]MDH5295328.1 methyltransferase domain-containing protein [Acidimicrobiia bacterium]